MKGLWQLLRYTVVGVCSNAILYGIYLIETTFGLGHVLAATIVYGLGVLLSFILNRRWTFNDEGLIGPSFRRYVFVYLLGYALNLFGLVALVDWGGYPHQLAEGLMIVMVALLLFVLQRRWVFQHQGSTLNRPSESATRDEYREYPIQ